MKRYDRQYLKALVSSGERTVAASDGEVLRTSDMRGIAPLLEWQSEGVDLGGYYVADKIVGKAAAMIYAVLKPAAVHAQVMSKKGAMTLAEHGIEAECDELADMIINRKGTGQCPMEEAVAEIEDPVAAIAALRKRAAELRSAE